MSREDIKIRIPTQPGQPGVPQEAMQVHRRNPIQRARRSQTCRDGARRPTRSAPRPGALRSRQVRSKKRMRSSTWPPARAEIVVERREEEATESASQALVTFLTVILFGLGWAHVELDRGWSARSPENHYPGSPATSSSARNPARSDVVAPSRKAGLERASTMTIESAQVRAQARKERGPDDERKR